MSNVWVQPIVVLWSDFPQGSIQSDGVAWVAGKRLAGVLAARPAMLSEEQTGEIMAVVHSSFGS